MTHRLLLVDDEPHNLEILHEFLDGEDFELVDALDGAEALERLEQDARGFDAVLLDRMMPRLDGMQVLHRMRRDDRWRYVPVVLQTALSSRDQVAEGLREGAYYYLPKPYDREVLLAVVRGALAQKETLTHLRNRVARGEAVPALIQDARFLVGTPSAARAVAGFVALACRDPAIAMLGLVELCANAFAFGHLRLTREERRRRATQRDWEAEFERLCAEAERAGLRVEIAIRRLPEGIEFRIADRGPGFDWQTAIANAASGGIAFCRDLAFDRLAYEDEGRVAIATLMTVAPPR